MYVNDSISANCSYSEKYFKVVEKIETEILCFTTPSFFSESRNKFEIMWKNMVVRQTTDDNIIRSMHFSCWITKATDVHLEHVTIIACLRHQRLHESDSLLRYTYTVCLVKLYVVLQALLSAVKDTD